MKRNFPLKQFLILSSCFSFFCLSSTAQDNHGFSYDAGQVVYQHVFESHVTDVSELLTLISKHVRGLPSSRDIEGADITITGRIEKHTIDRKRYSERGYMSSWMPFAHGLPISYNFKIDIREGRYRLIIPSFAFDPVDVGSMVFRYHSGDFYRTSKNRFRTSKTIQGAMSLMDAYFSEFFDITIKADADSDEW
jgi:hypothetical protein